MKKHSSSFCSNPDNNPFKDSRGAWRSRSLFVEHANSSYPAFFTIKDYDKENFPSLKKLYLSYDHLPNEEYNFAEEILGGWKHWQWLQSGFLKPYIKEWREELEIKLKANAIKAIARTSKEGGSAGLTAAKWLAEKGYAPSRGRPSKAEKAQHLKKEQEALDSVADDLRRLNLVKINGS